MSFYVLSVGKTFLIPALPAFLPRLFILISNIGKAERLRSLWQKPVLFFDMWGSAFYSSDYSLPTLAKVAHVAQVYLTLIKFC